MGNVLNSVCDGMRLALRFRRGGREVAVGAPVVVQRCTLEISHTL